MEDANKPGGRPRLFLIDYWCMSEVWELGRKAAGDAANANAGAKKKAGKGKKKKGNGMVQHAGRALLLLTQ